MNFIKKHSPRAFLTVHLILSLDLLTTHCNFDILPSKANCAFPYSTNLLNIQSKAAPGMV